MACVEDDWLLPVIFFAFFAFFCLFCLFLSSLPALFLCFLVFFAFPCLFPAFFAFPAAFFTLFCRPCAFLIKKPRTNPLFAFFLGWVRRTNGIFYLNPVLISCRQAGKSCQAPTPGGLRSKGFTTFFRRTIISGWTGWSYCAIIILSNIFVALFSSWGGS